VGQHGVVSTCPSVCHRASRCRGLARRPLPAHFPGNGATRKGARDNLRREFRRTLAAAHAFYDAPAWVFTFAYSLFALAVVATWWYFPPKRNRRAD
jgi:hypothetical protein